VRAVLLAGAFTIMNSSLKVLLLVVAATFWLPETVRAYRPRGTTMTGVIQSVDHTTRWISFARDDGTTRRFVYGRLARFWQGTPDSSPAALKPGMKVRVNFHNPLFGPDYATQIVLLAEPRT
jgi:hypothetical protein